MKPIGKFVIITLCLAVPAFLDCSNDNLAGGVTEVGNAKGRAVRQDGTPVAHAKVSFLSVDHDPRNASATIDSTTTNTDGAYVDSVAVGTYNVFIDGDTIVSVQDSVVILAETTTVIPDDTLKVPGTIKGISFMPGQRDTNQVRMTIYIPGTNYLTKPNIGGNFWFSSVPEGSFTIIFDPTLDEYYVKFVNVEVKAGDTIDLDTVVIYGDSLTGKPVANAGKDTTVMVGSTITLNGSGWDTLGQVVKYEWDIGATGNFVETSTGDTTFVVPDNPTTLQCVVKVTDNDGNVTIDTAIVKVVKRTFNLATSSAAFAPRTGHSLTPFQGKLWIIGGVIDTGDVGQQRTNDVWCSSDGQNWVEMTASAQFPPRSYHEALVYNSRMWILGGNTGHPDNDIWWSTNGTNWIQVAVVTPFPKRHAHTAIVFDSKMWVIGGDGGDSTLNDVWYSTDGGNWVSATYTAAFKGRENHTSLVFDNKIWIMGGYGSCYTKFADVWCSTNGLHWTEVAHEAPFSKRNAHTSVVFEGKLWVIAGVVSETCSGSAFYKNDAWCSSDGINWMQVTEDAGFSVRTNPVACVLDDKVWLVGGSSVDIGGPLNDVWFLQ